MTHFTHMQLPRVCVCDLPQEGGTPEGYPGLLRKR